MTEINEKTGNDMTVKQPEIDDVEFVESVCLRMNVDLYYTEIC